jgi:MFS family permease
MGVLMLGAGLQSSLLGIRATLEGFPTMVTGVVMAFYYVGYLFGTIAAPRLIRNVGHVRVFAALAAVASAATLVQAAYVHLVVGGNAPRDWTLLRGYLRRRGKLVECPRDADEPVQAVRRLMVVLYVGLGSRSSC